MPQTVHLFSQAVHQKYRRLPVWLPGSGMSVGDVGLLHDDRTWTKLLRLADLGVNTTAEPEPAPALTYSDVGGKTTRVAARMSGSGPAEIPGIPEGQFGIHAQFDEAAAFVFEAADCLVTRLAGVYDAEEQLKLLYATSARWQTNWVYVAEVLTAEKFFLAVSQGSHGEVSIALGADATSASIGSLKASAQIGVRTDTVQSFYSASRTPVMYRARSLRRRHFGNASFQDSISRMSEEEVSERLIFEDVTA